MKRAGVVLTVLLVLGVAVRFAPSRWKARALSILPVRTGAPSGGGLMPAGPGTESVTCWYPPRAGLEPVAEERRIAASTNPQDRLARLFAELHQPPSDPAAEPALPAGLAPRAVFLAADGTVYLDFPATVFERTLGPRDELVLLRAIARTCLTNVPQAAAVVILADGAPRIPLFGHFPGGGRYLLPRSAPERKTRRGRAATR